jgi:hypothetical protein
MDNNLASSVSVGFPCMERVSAVGCRKVPASGLQSGGSGEQRSAPGADATESRRILRGEVASVDRTIVLYLRDAGLAMINQGDSTVKLSEEPYVVPLRRQLGDVLTWRSA